MTNLKIISIGKYSEGEILLKKQFSKGILHLDQFSHAIIMYQQENALHFCIAKIVNTNKITGIISIISNIPDNCSIIDIKPYFPCEDRVVSCTAPKKHCSIVTNTRDDTIPCVGNIIRRDGEFILKLNDIPAEEIISGASHVRIFWWFDRFDKDDYRKVVTCNPPYENAPETGVFASRSPVRPNPIAITTARILSIYNKEISVTELDCFENTPIIGLLPYNPATESINNTVVPNWLSHWRDSVDDSEYKSGKINIKPSKLLSLIHKKSNSPDIFISENKSNIKPTSISVKGARQNNLKDIDAEIPYGSITAVTGVSGSGKSSLAFDTVYTECCRRFTDASGEESSSARPDMKSMSGTLPAVAVSQKSIGRNPRSTVGTVTDMSDSLRLLFSEIGIRHCPDCGEALIRMTTDEIELFLSENKNVIVTDIRNGIYYTVCDGEEMILSTHQSCPHCGKIMFDISPSTFSFANSESACPVCHGYGKKMDIDADSIVSNPNISLLDGASEWWGKLRTFLKNPSHNWMKGEIIALANDLDVDLEKPWRELPEEFKHQAIYGSDGRLVHLKFEDKKRGRNGDISRPVEGAYNSIKRLFNENQADVIAKKFMRETSCYYCNGERLNHEGRMVTIAGYRFPEVVNMSLAKLIDWCTNLPVELSDAELNKAEPILQKMYFVLKSSIDLGIGYLTLDRSVPTLSGGELQRLKLISQLGSDISGILYVLDEPTAGLHPKDYEKLISAIKRLRDNGNTIMLVEHNRDIINLADKIIDIGPSAGENGGYIVADGTPAEIMNNSDSETGKYLSGTSRISIPPKEPTNDFVSFSGISFNNLKNIDISFPKASITCVTGVSGSGKSTLVKGVIYPALLENKLVHCRSVADGNFDSVVLADQQPIGRNPRSVPATYMGIMDEIRSIYARNCELTPSHFSFNSPVGQCDNCHGDGFIKAEYLDNVWVKCPVCMGKRFKKDVLDIKIKDKNIFDVLEMNVDEAINFFADESKIIAPLKSLKDVGLGYIKLGQNSATLSGGEAQRIKLAKNLYDKMNRNTLYLLDEPTTGLHFSDIQNLMILLRRLTQNGNTIIIIEHNMDVVRCADYIIDLGPGSGENGGNVVAAGRTEDIKKDKDSYTGRYL